MNAFWQILWMICKVSLFGLALLALFGGGICGTIFVFSGGFGGQSLVGWGLLLIVVGGVGGVVAVKIAKSFKSRVPQQSPTNQPPSDDGSGWDKAE